jgi:hypothetical protein
MSSEAMSGAVWLPIRPTQLASLERLLNEADIVVRGNYHDAGKLDLSEYIANSALGGVEFRALFDRNLLSPLVRLAAGDSLSGNNESIQAGRQACACIAFCILADILVEPSMAMYEFASSNGNDAAQVEVRHFRVADNADPVAFLDIALGNADRLPASHIAEVASSPGVVGQVSQEGNFEKALWMWKPNYLYVLKTLDLIRSGLKPFDAAFELLRWQAEDAFYNAAASLYCLAAISHQPPRGGMLKSINSPNRAFLRRGARNATWDICLLQQFGKFVTTPNSPSWSLWTSDIALREIARILFIPTEDSADAWLAHFFERFWGTRDGKRLWTTYHGRSKSAAIGSESCSNIIKAAFERTTCDICELESRLGIRAAA